MKTNSENIINNTSYTKQENSKACALRSPQVQALPLVFTSKINDRSKLRPLSKIINSLGETKHFPASTKEWYNSIYAYNSTYAKNLPSADRNLSKIIKSYFNLYFSKRIIKSKKIATRFRRLSFKRIFVSKAEIKHTSEKVNITLYIYNEEKRILARKIKRLELCLYQNGIAATKLRRNAGLLMPLASQAEQIDNMYYKLIGPVFNHILPSLWYINNIVKLMLKLKEGNLLNDFEDKEKQIIIQNKPITLSILNKVEDQNKEVLLKYMGESRLLSIINAINEINPQYMADPTSIEDNIRKVSPYFFSIVDILNKLPNNDINTVEVAIKKFVGRIILDKEMSLSAHYNLLLNLNKMKFESKFLSKIEPLITNLYNKKVEFNIVNLKTLCFNSDMFTEAITVKLRNRENRLLKVLRSSLHMVKLPKINRIREKYGKSNKGVLWLNSVKNLRVNSPIYIRNLNKDFLSQFIFDLLSSKSPLKLQDKEILEQDKTSNIENMVFSSLKHKITAGVRLEAKGRLTRRFTASRAVFKIKWKGGLKNIDSSYKGLSSVLLRGHAKSNVQYSMFNSKTRNGAFGLKGWISSK
jgi:hypothetical protein